jgi:hypothetical protein
MAVETRSAVIGAAGTAGLVFITAIAVLAIRSCDTSTTKATTAPITLPTSPPTQAQGPGPTATTTPVTFPITNNLVTLDGQARSVETTASLSGLSSIHVSGDPVLTVDGAVAGRGVGTLTAAGGDVTITGTEMAVAGRARIQPGVVTLNSSGLQSTSVTLSQTAVVSAVTLTFQPKVTNSSTTVPSVSLTSPVTVTNASAGLGGGDLRWVDAPSELHAVTSEGDLSWAGSGDIQTGNGPLRATYLGVRAQDMVATLQRSSSTVTVNGTGHALQAYANGVPQFRVPARIDVLSTGATTGFLGRRHAFVWTPRNLNSVFDMAILSIHPGNAAGGSVHVGLLPMPPMFGGEPHALVGGDTSGLKGGSAIDSLIARNGDDKRSIGYDAGAGQEIVLIVQGNFDTITVTIPTY